jgi:hypothetical protein
MAEPQPLTEEQKEQLKKVLTNLTAKMIAYKIVRRLGASPWQAWVSVTALFKLDTIIGLLEEEVELEDGGE